MRKYTPLKKINELCNLKVDFVYSKLLLNIEMKPEKSLMHLINNLFDDCYSTDLIARHGGMGDVLFEKYKHAKDDLCIALKNVNYIEIISAYYFYNKYSEQMFYKINACRNFDDALQETESLLKQISDDYDVLQRGGRHNKKLASIGFYKLLKNYYRKDNASVIEGRVNFNEKQQLMTYSFFDAVNDANKFIHTGFFQKKLHVVISAFSLLKTSLKKKRKSLKIFLPD